MLSLNTKGQNWFRGLEFKKSKIMIIYINERETRVISNDKIIKLPVQFWMFSVFLFLFQLSRKVL